MNTPEQSRSGAVATIRATCPTCGDVDLTIPQVRAMLCATTNEGSYAFQCPECRFAVSKPADASVVDLLVAAGVELSIWESPAELFEQHDGPAITPDDLLDFHFALQQPGWFERLVGVS